mmetsp:Transcript_74051/g.130886  ORF Transcript_74051/g.130886 Transcript_74051/m.130886 type:complete len:276 (-) Transcript_74051:30-857(-)
MELSAQQATLAATEAAKLVLQVYTNRKGGAETFRTEAQVLKDRIAELACDEVQEECKKLLRQMHKTFVAKTQSSWRPYVLSILQCLGTPREELKELVGKGDKATLALFHEFDVNESKSLKKIIRQKVKLVSPKTSKEEKDAAQMAAPLTPEKRKRAELDLTPSKKCREDALLTDEEKAAQKDAARHRAAEIAERSQAFQRTYLQRHLQRIEARKDEPILEIIEGLEKLGDILGEDLPIFLRSPLPEKEAKSDRSQIQGQRRSALRIHSKQSSATP